MVMNNVASRELSKELSELSDWVDSGATWFKHGKDVWSNNTPYEIAPQLGFKEFNPAYPLGYLLQKLPLHTTLELYGPTEWRCAYAGKTLRAETAEDAVAALAIELFKQGL